MLTFENIEFESNRSKIFNLNKRTCILFAGHVTDHTSIWRDAFQGKNSDSMTTAQIAESYAAAFQTLRLKQAEAKFLKRKVTQQRHSIPYTEKCPIMKRASFVDN